MTLICVSCMSEYEVMEELVVKDRAAYMGWLTTKSSTMGLDSLHRLYIRQSDPDIRVLDFLKKTDNGYRLTSSEDLLDSLHIDSVRFQKFQLLVNKLNGYE